MERHSGILLHIATLPCRYGIGQLGKCAYDFADFLADSAQSYWQVLPLVPTGYGDSPYQSCCASAGNEYFIDLDLLAKEGLLTDEELASCVTEADSRINYENLYYTRYEILRKAFSRYDKTAGSLPITHCSARLKTASEARPGTNGTTSSDFATPKL